MNHFLFATGGDWETTTLHNNGREFSAAQLFVEIHAGQDVFGEYCEGGIQMGGDLTALVRPEVDPMSPLSIFPGVLEMSFPGNVVIIENTHPMGIFEYTRISYNGRDVTERIVELYVDINAVDNVVQGYITLYKAHWFGSDEVATFNFV